MAATPVWEVDLAVDGPVTLRGHYTSSQQKGFHPDNPFYSDIEIRGIPSGLRATITARAANEHIAREAAVFFFGRMLDVLAFEVDLKIFLSLTEREHPRNVRDRQNLRRVIEHQEINDAFRKADDLAITEAPFLRSLSWYRKGLNTEDPFDRFLAFWNVIERVAAEYYRYVPSIDQDRAKNGSKSQIWECFKALWGPCEQWPIIGGQDKWIDENYEIRKDIAHGIKPVDIRKVTLVLSKVDTIQQVAWRFLQEWEDNFLSVGWQEPSESLTDF